MKAILGKKKKISQKQEESLTQIIGGKRWRTWWKKNEQNLVASEIFRG